MAKHRKGRHRRGLHAQRMTAPGTAPGTVAVHPDASAPVIRVFNFGPDRLEEVAISRLDRLTGYLSRPGVTWVNVDGLGDAKTIEKLGEFFGLHALALEDVVNVHQRAKVEEYGDHLFIVARMVSWNGVLETEQLSMFLGKNFVLTLQERPGDCLDPVRERLRSNRGRIRKAGADYLAYALLDAVIDAYFPVIDSYGDRLDRLDETIGSQAAQARMHEVHAIRGDMMVLRRAIRPARDCIAGLVRDPHPLITQDTQLYFRDCNDHIVQLLDLLDTYREMCGNLRDFYLSLVSQRMNEVMKVLTIIATIFIPLGFIAGVYGMNFKHMPELDWSLGYPMALLSMTAVAVGLLLFFWRRGWLNGASELDSDDDARRA